MEHLSMPALFGELIETFHLKGCFKDFAVVSAGNINDTYVLETLLPNGDTRHYTVQRLNRFVFSDPEAVASNAFEVTAHIERKLREQGVPDLRRRVLHYYPAEDGTFFHRAPDGSCWRVFSYVYHAVNTGVADARILRGTGTAFGRFQRMLADFPAGKLAVTIPDFHNTPKRFADLERAAGEDVCGRLADVRELYDRLLALREQAGLLHRLHREGKLPLRVVHNDTKCNNVMFDSVTLEPLAVIDLDTVMPGFVAHDFGDAVRFACNTAPEDAEDLSSVSLDLEAFSRFAEGFLPEVYGILTETELSTLPDGVLLITWELAARFLKDDLDGDVYFKCRKPRHNRIRAACQLKLAEDISRKLPEMRHILRLVCADCEP
ncbi:MAG: aminoglycoside phosphotransferase family protein [Oscillospiraceae bacterium]|nr:aminoglycoside phosphotransferase family protein [Oscillospiraceae bacterium]